MAPTEATVLTNYLLVPAQLPAIVSLKEFTESFPRPQQSSPQIRKLYRDLQNQRNALIDEVASNIETEVKRGKVLRREVLRAKREAEYQEGDDEIDLERAVSFLFCIHSTILHSLQCHVAEGASPTGRLAPPFVTRHGGRGGQCRPGIACKSQSNLKA